MNDESARIADALADRYDIERPLGVGMTSIVYLATDLKHCRKVAIKVFRPEVAATMGAARFLREIEIVASLAHPHILPLHDSGQAAGALYYVMPYVDGESLRTRLAREGQLPIEDAVRIAREVGDALSHAHSHHIVHRDIKPENILLEAGHAVVSDFGIACGSSAEDAEHLTEPGVVIGTPAYMSPEQAGGETTDARADIYALGCVLYEMLTGEAPFPGPSVLAILARKAAGPVPSVRLTRDSVPVALEQIVTKALATEPGDRFATAAEFTEALSLKRVPTPAPASSIAVLPFTNLSAEPETDYFSDGITEEITHALAKVHSLRVASRTSAFAFKERRADIRAIGRELHVATVLEGSVRRAGNHLRVNVQLVNVADGFQLWAERFDREMVDVFVIEDEIARKVVDALRVILREEEHRQLVKASTAVVAAYDYYLRGRQFFHQSRKKSLQYARGMFARAIEADPDYALAYAGVADCCSLLHLYYPEQEHDLEEADRASRRALELAPELPEAHAARGFALFQMRRHEDAECEFEAAIRLDPKQYEARYFYARLRFVQGRFADAALLFEEASRVRESYEASFFAAQSFAALGSEVSAQAAYRRASRIVTRYLEMNPDDPRAATMCAVSSCRLGEKSKGLQWAERALAIDPADAGVRYNVACLFALEGLSDRALDCLEQAMKHGFGNRDWISRDPDLASLREHPRFQALLRE